VGLLTLGAGIESSTHMGSDQTAAEALQEAETESVSR
jgi:DMSO reductase anchor subunit